MTKSVLISIQPKWCELIASGKKTIEVRKTRPKLEPPFKCYIYETKGKVERPRGEENGYIYQEGRGAVIGEFVCDKIYDCDADSVGLFDKSEGSYLLECCLTWREIFLYSRGALPLYGWHISDLVIYDKPKGLDKFRKPCISPEIPYCPSCEVGYEYISEEEAEFYRVDGWCNTEWRCLNFIERPPQSWCYVEEIHRARSGDKDDKQTAYWFEGAVCL